MITVSQRCPGAESGLKVCPFRFSIREWGRGMEACQEGPVLFARPGGSGRHGAAGLQPFSRSLLCSAVHEGLAGWVPDLPA